MDGVGEWMVVRVLEDAWIGLDLFRPPEVL